ncbi:hypothetical protein D9M70_519900 [compost metagenome]
MAPVPTAVDIKPLAFDQVPRATPCTPVAEAKAPRALAFCAVAEALVPRAVLCEPVDSEETPMEMLAEAVNAPGSVSAGSAGLSPANAPSPIAMECSCMAFDEPIATDLSPAALASSPVELALKYLEPCSYNDVNASPTLS